MILKSATINFLFYPLFSLSIMFFVPTTLAIAANLGNKDNGKMIAEQLCSGCHSIYNKGDSPFAKAPPFRDFLKNWSPESLAEALAEGIVVGHEAMPEFQFGPEVLADFLAYLSTLSDKDPEIGTFP
jgi:mono/diheme cytochrome c family protein